MTNQATTPTQQAQQAQLYEHLASSLKKDLRDYWIGGRTDITLLHEQLEQLGWALNALSSIGHCNFHLLNRAISYYLMHSPADIHEKSRVTQAMEEATRTALKLSLHSIEIGCWSWTINKIVDNLNEINSTDDEA